jgi:hypothetical protein
MTYVKNLGRMQDDNLVLHDATAEITASALATVGGAAAAGIVDIGNVPVAFDVVFDFSVIDCGTDDLYEMHIVGADSAAFDTTVTNLGTLRLGCHEVVGSTVSTGDQLQDLGAGKYVLTCRNHMAGTTYRYVRLCFELAGSGLGITPAGDIFIANVRAG